MTRVLAVSGSLRKGEGATTRILAPFLEGMKDEGASVELVYVKDCKIEPCRGEFHCWYTKPGECIIKDGMQELYQKLRASDILVIATPVYIPLPGEMQNFLNRFALSSSPCSASGKAGPEEGSTANTTSVRSSWSRPGTGGRRRTAAPS